MFVWPRGIMAAAPRICVPVVKFLCSFSPVGEPGGALRILKAARYRENVFIFQLSTKETPVTGLRCHGFPAPQDNKNYIFHVLLELFPQSFIYERPQLCKVHLQSCLAKKY